MSACPHPDESLTLFAAGALEPGDEARVRAHLESCAACRSEVDASREVLGLAALPPPSAREQAVLAALPRTTVGVWRKSLVQQASRMRTAGALMAAAAVALLALEPVVLHRETPLVPRTTLVEPSPLPAEDTSSELEQWALTNPLSDVLESSDVDLEDPEADEALADLDADDFLSIPNPGESL